jgi:WD40 repeat protein
MYERNENSCQLNYLRKLILPSSNKSNEIIKSLALSPNEETLLAGTNYNHLYQFSFSKKETNIFQYAIDSGHTGSIITGVICIRKPILFTLGIDRCLKIWNLQTKLVIK